MSSTRTPMHCLPPQLSAVHGVPTSIYFKGVLIDGDGRMNLYQRYLGYVEGTRFPENYPFPLHFRSRNERCEIFAFPREKGKIRILYI